MWSRVLKMTIAGFLDQSSLQDLRWKEIATAVHFLWQGKGYILCVIVFVCNGIDRQIDIWFSCNGENIEHHALYGWYFWHLYIYICSLGHSLCRLLCSCFSFNECFVASALCAVHSRYDAPEFVSKCSLSQHVYCTMCFCFARIYVTNRHSAGWPVVAETLTLEVSCLHAVETRSFKLSLMVNKHCWASQPQVHPSADNLDIIF